MSPQPEEMTIIHRAATQWAMRGLRLLPTEFHGRKATLDRWPEAASNVPADVDRRFRGGDVNIALACGAQPNGWSLLAVDVDAHSGGKETWSALVAEHGPLPMPYPMHTTPSGGRHLFFNVPPELCLTGTNTLGEGIDTRGGRLVGGVHTGCGYLLLPPSIAASKLPETQGELLSYGAQPGRSLLDVDPGPAPEWMLAMLARPEPEPARVEQSVRRHPSQGLRTDSGPADWVRANLRWEHYLTKHGWTSRGPKYWVRPGKVGEHAGQLHDNGRLAFWSSTVPAELKNLAKRQVDGGFSVSLFSFIAAYEFGGDEAALGRHVRKEWMPQPVVISAAGAEPEQAPPAAAPQSASQHLDEAFWSARPYLAHILQAARSMRVSPEALLLNVLVRYSAQVSPDIQLPAFGTLDLFGVVVGRSGDGKSQAAKVAREVIADSTLPQIMMDRVIGSGEGLVEAFMITETDPNDKKVKVRKVGNQAIHFISDEGKTLMGQMERSGTTIASTMCSAWAGEALGNTNADQTRNRHIPPRKVRVCAIVNMQVANANLLYSKDLVIMGFTSRMLFAPALDPDMPDVAPPWPGQLELPDYSYRLAFPQVVTYAPEIVAEIDDGIVASRRGLLVRDERETHRTLQRLKVATFFALMDARMDVNLDDWALADDIVVMSSAVLSYLDSFTSLQTSDGRRIAYDLQIEKETYIEEGKHNKAVARIARRLLGRVTKDGLLWGDARRALASRDRDLFEEAVDHLVGSGFVRVEDGVLRLA